MKTDIFDCFVTVVKEVNTHTHTHLMALWPWLPGWAGTRKVEPVWILLKQETVSGSGISWAICKSASRSRQITMLAPHHSVFYRPDALPATQPTVSKHWRHKEVKSKKLNCDQSREVFAKVILPFVCLLCCVQLLAATIFSSEENGHEQLRTWQPWYRDVWCHWLCGRLCK